MWGRNRKTVEAKISADAQPGVLQDAVRKTRIEIAEKSSVVVDLRDAEVARLELLNDALDPLFSETPPDVDLLDRGISRGDTPRLWLDAISHVAMARDKRRYRFVQDTRFGRKVLAESNDIARLSRRSPITSRPASSNANGRWRKTRGRCERDCIRACMEAGADRAGARSGRSCLG